MRHRRAAIAEVKRQIVASGKKPCHFTVGKLVKAINALIKSGWKPALWFWEIS